jgi:guanylate kinase
MRITEAVVHVLKSIEFVHAVPHTTREARSTEVDGVDYHFVTQEVMEEGLSNHKFIEAGKYKENMYGTSLQSIRDPSEQGKVVIMNTQLRAVTRLQAFGDLHPVVILLKPNSVEELQQALESGAGAGQAPSEAKVGSLYSATLKTENEFSHIFTHVVLTGPSLATTVRAVANIVHHCMVAEYWVDTFQPLPLVPLEEVASPRQQSTRMSPMSIYLEGTVPGESTVDGPDEPESESTLRRSASKQRSSRRKKRNRRGVSYCPVSVVVKRNDKNSFGFSVAGGIEDDLLPAIVLKNVEPLVIDGPALNRGDEIVSVDGHSVAGLPHAKVINMIKAAGETMELMVFKRKGTAATGHKITDLVAMQPATEHEVELQQRVRDHRSLK